MASENVDNRIRLHSPAAVYYMYLTISGLPVKTPSPKICGHFFNLVGLAVSVQALLIAHLGYRGSHVLKCKVQKIVCS